MEDEFQNAKKVVNKVANATKDTVRNVKNTVKNVRRTVMSLPAVLVLLKVFLVIAIIVSIIFVVSSFIEIIAEASEYSEYNENNLVDMGAELDKFKEYLHQWEGHEGISEDGKKYIVGTDGAGHPTVGYGIDIYNSGFKDRFIEAGYDISIGSLIDVDFVDALEDEEIQSAISYVESKCSELNLTIYQKYALVSRIYNCGKGGAFSERNGKTFKEAYNAYWNQETDDEYGVTANDNMYQHDLYQQYMSQPNTSNGEYMKGLELRRKSEWILFKTGYYDKIDKWCSNTTSSEGDLENSLPSDFEGNATIVENAIRCHRYLRENGFKYAQAGANIPITSKNGTIDCSSYVSWVLYESGFSQFKGYQKTSSVIRANSWGWAEVSKSEALPGDILCYNGHVEIVAKCLGNGKFRVYNCGSNGAIQATGTTELPESSSGKNATILKILRPSK